MGFQAETPAVQPVVRSPASKEADVHLPGVAPGLVVAPGEIPVDSPAWTDKVKELLIGRPREIADAHIFHRVSLIALFAWVGLGADGLSSSCYGPAEAFHALGEHRHLAVLLALATIATVLIISLCYSHIIEAFPSGGGGYLVASKVLGQHIGLVSGSALLVDYVLTITVSIAAAGDAIFGLLPTNLEPLKLYGEAAAVLLLLILNLRGIRESIIALLPIFLLFLVTHGLVIAGVFVLHGGEVQTIAQGLSDEIRADLASPEIGLFGMLFVLLHAYSLGAGTYTGIEAVSNSMPVLREPKVATAKRTMAYMAISLSFTAGGLMVGYLLLDVRPIEGETMNQTLIAACLRDLGYAGTWMGRAFLLVAMLSAGALLLVAAQAGFIDGPRILANMARDSWVPHWFANYSDRLTNHNGIVLMGVAAMVALIQTGGKVSTLVIMYSINVFLTFTISMIAMCRYWHLFRDRNPLWKRRLRLFIVGAILCGSILSVTIASKFQEGGWRTIATTGLCVAVCLAIRHEYKSVRRKLRQLNESFAGLAHLPALPTSRICDPTSPTAAVLVGGYGGLGIHTFLNALRMTPDYFKNAVFLSVGVVDSGNFKGPGALEELKRDTAAQLSEYVDMARRVGLPATSYMSLGTDVAEEIEHLCLAVIKDFPKTVFFAGQLVFKEERWFHRLLHNETAFSVQRRLHLKGLSLVILPTRMR